MVVVVGIFKRKGGQVRARAIKMKTLVIFLLMASFSYAGEVTLSWEPPVECQNVPIAVTAYDGAGNESGFSNEVVTTTEACDTVGYKVYWGGVPETGVYLHSMDVGNVTTHGLDLNEKPEGLEVK
jgi:hypothetical protein